MQSSGIVPTPSTPPTSGGPPGTRRPGGGAEASREGRPPFRGLLQPRKTGRDGAGTSAGAAAAASAALTRAEAPLAIPAREISVRAVAPRPEVGRVLVGPAHAAAEARVELRGGPFDGTSIHLVTVAGGVEARLGAPTEAARLALANVMDRVGLHLRSRGIVVRPGAPLETGSRHRAREPRQK